MVRNESGSHVLVREGTACEIRPNDLFDYQGVLWRIVKPIQAGQFLLVRSQGRDVVAALTPEELECEWRALN